MKKLFVAILVILIIAMSIYLVIKHKKEAEDAQVKPMPEFGKITIGNAAPLFKDGLPKDYAVIDVRTDEEYNKQHTEGTLHIPVALFEADGACAKVQAMLPKDKKMIFVCPSGPRAEEMYYDLTDPVKDGACGFEKKGKYFLIAHVTYGKNNLELK